MRIMFPPESFTPQAGDEALEDLRTRLRATRWPDSPEDAGWSIGTDLDYLRELVAYWADGFDWRAQEAALNELPRYRLEVGGLRIHYVHAKAVAPAGPVLPLVLTHGWPDSFWRYSKVIPLLTDPGAHGGDPADAFDVVVPDVPGFGYSDIPVPALDSIAVAELWADLMYSLGYPRFGAAGGDIGSHVSRYLALDHPHRVVAVHRTDAGLPIFLGDPAELAPEERAWIESAAAWGRDEGAYAADPPHQAPDGGRRAQRLAGRAGRVDRREARVLERPASAPGTRSSPTSRSTGSPGRSARRCACTAPTPRSRPRSTPAGSRRRRASRSSRATSSGRPGPGSTASPNTVRATEPPRGGHFAAFEEPELYAEELRAFFRPYR